MAGRRVDLARAGRYERNGPVNAGSRPPSLRKTREPSFARTTHTPTATPHRYRRAQTPRLRRPSAGRHAVQWISGQCALYPARRVRARDSPLASSPPREDPKSDCACAGNAGVSWCLTHPPHCTCKPHVPLLTYPPRLPIHAKVRARARDGHEPCSSSMAFVCLNRLRRLPHGVNFCWICLCTWHRNST